MMALELLWFYIVVVAQILGFLTPSVHFSLRLLSFRFVQFVVLQHQLL